MATDRNITHFVFGEGTDNLDSDEC